MRIGPQTAPGISRALFWLVNRMIEPSRKRGSHAGETGISVGGYGVPNAALKGWAAPQGTLKRIADDIVEMR